MSAPSRHADTARNVILNKASNDLWDIVSGHDPEIHNLNNRVWDRLDAMTVEIEQRCTNLSQASVAAALEAAAMAAKLAGPDQAMRDYELSDVGKDRRVMSMRCEAAIRALITDRDRNALAAHVAAEVAKARAEDAAWLPVEDAPQDGTAVITIKSNGDVAKGAWYKNPFGDENTFIDRASGKWWTAVGWMPMPKALAQIGAKP